MLWDEPGSPTVTLFLSVAVVVVIFVAFPKVRRTLLGIWDGLDAIDTLFYVLVALVFVGAVSWAIAYRSSCQACCRSALKIRCTR
jgi:hypothetical protein